MPGRLASLTTRGRCLLTAGLAAALCAVLVHERDLLRVAAFAVTLPLLASVIVGFTQLRLRADRELAPARIAVGGECQAHLRLRGTGVLSGRLLLEDVLSPALGGPRRTVVARLPVTLSYPLPAAQRGVHALGPLIARITDPLGLAEYNRLLAVPSRLVVTPTVVALTGLAAGGEPGGREANDGRVGVGPSQDAVGVRDYRQGDDLRKVHWRTSARRDELMVRVEEWRERGGATVLLDHRGGAHRGSGATSSLEYAVSLAASVYVHLRQRGQRVRLVTGDGRMLAGHGTGFGARYEAGHGAGHGAGHTIDTALDALAALRATEHHDLAWRPAMTERQEMIAVLGAVEPADVEQLLAHRSRGLRSHAVLLDVTAWATPAAPCGQPVNGDVSRGSHRHSRVATAPDPALVATQLVAAGWSVTVARPDQPLSAVWDQLCIRSHTWSRTRPRT